MHSLIFFYFEQSQQPQPDVSVPPELRALAAVPEPPSYFQEQHYSSPNKMRHLVAELPSKWVMHGIKTPQWHEIMETKKNREFLLKINPVCMEMRKLELYSSKTLCQKHVLKRHGLL